ncbi:MAG: hypothetical protein C4324_11855 [Blastocatellia bacterium]
MKLIKYQFTILLSCLLLLLQCFAGSIAGQTRDSAIERRIDDILAKMTIAEKFGQLQQLDGEANGRFRPEHVALAEKCLLGSTLNVRGAEQVNELQRAAMRCRLKIPILFGFDVIHGYRTIFPVPLGEAASWDISLAEQTSAIAAAEARAAGVHWTFAPMVDIARDARWGRIVEGSGEDPFLGSMFSFARVRGFQGTDYSAPNKVMATAKHWAGYGAAEAGRDYNTTDLSERALREVYFPPFKAAVDAGVGSFMTAFNDLDGVPATANPFILKKVLRGEWKFDGLVVSDYTAVMELVFHGLARDEKSAAAYALNAGTDMEMASRLYNRYGEELIREGVVSKSALDDAVRNVLRVKFRLGLFERPFAEPEAEAREVFRKENLQAAKRAAERSFVLLKNDDRTLPFSKDVGKIAVIGYLADSKADMLGSWAGDGRPEDVITVKKALEEKFPGKEIIYAQGCDARCESESGFAAALDAVRRSDVAIVVAGETADMSGEAASRSNLDLPGLQTDLLKAISRIGKPYAVVLMNGRPLTINWVAEHAPAILETWFAGTMAGPAIADTLFGDVVPGGKLPVTFPRSVGQVPIYYNHKNTGRPFKESEKYTSKYLDASSRPLYPFGFGLSYTKFRLSNLRLDKYKILPDEAIRLTATLENTGDFAGDEVVQLYIHDVAASVTRPVRELRGFLRIYLRPGEKKEVEFTLSRKDLEFIGRDLKPVLEPGEFQVFVGNSSEGGLSSVFEVLDPSGRTSSSADKPASPPTAPVPAAIISAADDAFLEDLSKRAFLYLWEHSDPNTGLTLDRVRTDGRPPSAGDDHFQVASIAATGFALSANCIAADRGWQDRKEIAERTRNALRFFARRAEHKNGWFYHFVDQKTGIRRWRSELSSIDTALLLGGILTVRNCFADREITALADEIYHRVDFQWMLNGHPYLLSHGWRPETGWIPNRWDDYSEQAILYLLAIGSPTRPIPAASWYAFERKWQQYGDYHYLAAVSPLFIHQFSHAWVDFRGKRERRPPFVDYYENSVKATLAQRKFFADVLSRDFPGYSLNVWGLTASDSVRGYVDWGAPPRDPRIDGTVVPCAPAGSLMFTPTESLAALKEIKFRYGESVYGRYGFADAFNPHTGWVNRDVIGIDIGITLLSAENLRSGKIWYWFMQNEPIRRALAAIQLE